MSFYDNEKYEHFVYGLVDPVDGVIKYVGATMDTESRLSVHLSEARTGRTGKKNAWVRSLLRRGKIPRVKVLHRIVGRSKALKKEREVIIRMATSGKLTNAASIRDSRPVSKKMKTVSVALTKQEYKILTSLCKKADRTASNLFKIWVLSLNPEDTNFKSLLARIIKHPEQRP